MNTHIIIPISIIKDRIALAQREEEICKQSDFELAGQAARNRGNFYKMLLNDSGQISLSEENISEKIKILFPEPQHNDSIQTIYLWSGRCQGYKQALLDLLK